MAPIGLYARLCHAFLVLIIHSGYRHKAIHTHMIANNRRGKFV